MKQVRFLLIIIVMAMIQLPAIGKKKKLMLADNIQYYGEVYDKLPFGMGELQLNEDGGTAYDIISGFFGGGKVTDAKVFFGLSLWPRDPSNPEKRAATYKGTIEYEIKGEKYHTYLVYKLKDGILEIAESRDNNGNSYNRLSIHCKPQDSCIIERRAFHGETRTEFRGNFHHEEGDVNCIYTLFQEDSRKGFFHYHKKEKMSKEKEERLRAEEERKLATPEGLAQRIISMIGDKNQPFSEIESLADKLLAMEKTDEQRQAVKSVIEECKLMGTGYDSDKNLVLSMSHKGTERGKQELALVEKLQQQMIDSGDIEELMDFAYRCRRSGDIATAKKYFQQGADKGDAMCMRGLAFCYEDENNVEKAIEWYNKLLETDAKEQFAVDAMDYYKKISRPDLILKALKKAAVKSKDACLRLGYIYRTGHDWETKETGVKTTKNIATALKWYQKARDFGSKAALFFMADCYWTGGNGVVANKTKAVQLYLQMQKEHEIFDLNIAEADYKEKSMAYYRMGYCYENGIGVTKNINSAWYYYCDSNEPDAYYRRGVMLQRRWVYETLRPDLRMQQCRQLYQMAANMGHAQAKQALNRMYR